MKQELQALVIDDEPQVSSFVAEVLRMNGWQATEARSAEQVFEMIDERDWLLIFCDVVLGGASRRHARM